MTATPRMKDPLQLNELKDWGRVPTMIEGESHTSGVLISRNPDGSLGMHAGALDLPGYE